MKRTTLGAVATAALPLALLLAAPAAVDAQDHSHGHADGNCKNVSGTFASMPAQNCGSPVGMCTQGALTGKLKGAYELTMATLQPAMDPTIPSVFFYTGVSVITRKKGMLVGTDAGSLNLDPFAGGKFVALLTLTDGTDGYAGASGYIQIRGTLDFNTGGASGTYVGQVCTP